MIIVDKEKMGSIFKNLREEAGKKGKDFALVMNKARLSKFENGNTCLSYEEMEKSAEILGLTLSDFDYLFSNKRIYARYGIVFHTIRLQRGYKDNFFENLGVSSFRLKLFETGRIDLGFTLLDSMLQEIHVPEMDYTHWLNHGEDDYFIEYIKKIEAYFLKNEIEKLKNYNEEVSDVMEQIGYRISFLEEKTKVSDNEEVDYDGQLEIVTKQYSDYHILSLGIKSTYSELDDSEIEEASDFFMGIDYWTEFEIAMFTLIVKNLNFELTRDILLEFIKNKNLYENNFFYRRRIMQAVVRISLHFCNIHQVEAAKKVLLLSNPFLKNTDTYASCVYRFAQGYCQYCDGKIEGAEKMQFAIKTFQFLGEVGPQSKCQSFYDANVKL